MSKFAASYARIGVALGTLTLVVGSGKVSQVFADEAFDTSDTISQGETTLKSTGSFATLKTFIANLANQVLGIVLLLAGIIAIFYLVYSGFLYVTSAGNPEKVKTARQGIINAIIGIIIIVAAFFIVRFAGLIGNTISSADDVTP